MRVNNFSVLIPEGRERDSGHVEVRHNTVYSIRLGNHGYTRCDAEVSVDGKPVGGFRVERGGVLLLERPAHDSGRFTFFEVNSQQAVDAGGAGVHPSNAGLIQVVFRPERQQREVKTCGGVALNAFPEQTSFGASRGAAGITGLTGCSEQAFRSVPSLDYEPNAEVTISLRLVAMSGVRQLTPTPAGNKVPEPV